MPRKKSIAILVSIIDAFHENNVWKQAELRGRVGVTTETLRSTLDTLTSEGWNFERDEEPPHVYWSLPRGFFAGGVLLSQHEVVEAVRLLGRLRPSQSRERLIQLLVRNAPPSAQALPATSHHALGFDRESDEALGGIEDAITRRQALEVRYYTKSRGSFEWRTISFQRVTTSSPIRLCGVCHRTNELRWFRLDSVFAHRGCSADYVSATTEALDKFLDVSVDGYHDGTEPEHVAFFVRAPEARWVKANLLPPLSATEVEGGIQVEGEVAGMKRVAQFVVGLGGAARPLTPQLIALVEELARGALANLGSQD